MQTVPEPEEQPPARGEAQRQKRRLSDKILSAFHQACDQEDTVVAWELLYLLDAMATQWTGDGSGQQRRRRDTLVAAHERLWVLRHPERAAIDLAGRSDAA
jgi:hypothetical protein